MKSPTLVVVTDRNELKRAYCGCPPLIPPPPIPSLIVGKIRSLIIPVTPHDEPKRIVAKVDRLLARCDRVAEQLRQRQTTTEQLLTASIQRLLAEEN